MFNGIVDIAACRNAVLRKFETERNKIDQGLVKDSTGARVSAITMDEAYGLARIVIRECIVFDTGVAHRYVEQFPEILGMELVGSQVSDSIGHGVLRAVFARIEPSIRASVISQFSDYGINDLDGAVTSGIEMFHRHLTADPFARLRIHPDKVTAYLAEITEDAEEARFKLLVGQINNLVSELKSKPPAEARQAARALREASQFCLLAASGELSVFRQDVPELALAC